MADLSDVETALVSMLAAAVYPNGTGQASAVGVPCRLYRGWPIGPKLDADLAAGVANVSVYTRAGMTRNTTRFPNGWQDGTPPVATISAAVAGPAVTFSGSAGVSQLAGISANTGTWVYAAGPSDTPSTVAAALRGMIPGATGSGALVTLSGTAGAILARTGGIGTAVRELRRQVQGFLVTIWAPDHTTRDAIGSLLNVALADVSFLTLADTTAGRLIFHNDFVTDSTTKAALWRRDITLSVEYATSKTMSAAAMLFGTVDIGIAKNSAGLSGGPDILVEAGAGQPPLYVLQDGNGNTWLDGAFNPLGPPPT